MMTLADFKARTSAGTNPKRSNLLIQQMDALLALYEAMDATMTIEERMGLASKISDVSWGFLRPAPGRIVSSRKKAAVQALNLDAWMEKTRLCDELKRRAAQQKLLAKQQKEQLKAQQAQAKQQQAALLAKQQAAQQARQKWAAALAKVNALLGPEGYRDIRAKMLDPVVWPEFFDRQHRYAGDLEEPKQIWEETKTDRPFDVWLEKNFMPQNEFFSASSVRYLSADEREEYRIEIVGGIFRWVETQELVHTGNMYTFFSGDGHAIWACSADRRFYTGDHEVGTFHHSSFLGGLPVIGAGEWTINHGRLVMLSAKTGHYRSRFDDMFRTMLRLSANGVDLNSVAVSWPWPTKEANQFYRAMDFMRARPAERLAALYDQAGDHLVPIPAPPVPAPLAVN